MKGCLKILLIAFITAACSKPVISDVNKLTGIYSNLEYITQSGDVIGIEIFVVYSRKGYQVVFQDSEGEPSVPVVIPASVSPKRILFEIPKDVGSSYTGKFNGVFYEDKIVGSFEGLKDEIILIRRSSYWQ